MLVHLRVTPSYNVKRLGLFLRTRWMGCKFIAGLLQALPSREPPPDRLALRIRKFRTRPLALLPDFFSVLAGSLLGGYNSLAL